MSLDFTDYDVDYNYGVGGGGGSSHGNNHITRSSPQTDVLSSYKCVLLNYPVNSSSYSKVTYYSLWLLNSNVLYPPSEFTPLHHVGYQLSMVVLCGYVLVCKKSVWGFVLLSLFALMQGFWGLFVLKGVDVCVWNGVVLGIVLLRLCGVCCDGGSGGGGGRKSPGGRRVKGSVAGKGVVSSGSGYGVKSGGNNSEDLKDVYLRLFAPVRVSYKQFLRVVGCKRGFRVLGCGENYSVEKRSRVDALGLLVCGRLVVCQGGKPLHVILPFQFVDSPEYFGVATDELFQVTITALEESKVLVWHRDKLRLTIMNDEFLSTIFQHILSRDVCRKLISVSDTMVTTPTTTYSCNTSTTSTAISSPPHSSSSSQQQTSIIGNGGQTNPSNGNAASLLTNPSLTHTNNTLSSQPSQVIMLRKEKYAYQPTYLTSLSEEKVINGNGGGNGKGVNGFNGDEEDEEEDEEEDLEEEDLEEELEEDVVMDSVVCGNEKEPMLDNSVGVESK